MSTFSAREFNQDVSAAKRAALDGPVIVTDRGKPAFVLLTIDDYRRRMGGTGADLLARLAMGEDEFVEDFEPGRVTLDAPEL